MYPDDLDSKPAKGEGLNKKAIIFMDGYWPKDKSTGDLIQDKERLDRMNYAEKLQGLVTKIGGLFIEYKAETGTCVFQVMTAFPPLIEADSHIVVWMYKRSLDVQNWILLNFLQRLCVIFFRWNIFPSTSWRLTTLKKKEMQVSRMVWKEVWSRSSRLFRCDAK